MKTHILHLGTKVYEVGSMAVCNSTLNEQCHGNKYGWRISTVEDFGAYCYELGKEES